jgi:hypothetical protein
MVYLKLTHSRLGHLLGHSTDRYNTRLDILAGRDRHNNHFVVDAGRRNRRCGKLANGAATVKIIKLTIHRSRHRHAAVALAGIGPGHERRRGTAHTGHRGSTRLAPAGLGPEPDAGRSRHRIDLPADVRTSWGVIRIATENLRDKLSIAVGSVPASGGAETLGVGSPYLKQ